MAWAEFWNGLFPRALQDCIMVVLSAITVAILLLVCSCYVLCLEAMRYKLKAKKKRDLDDEYYAKAFEALQEKKRAIMNRINKAKAEKETQNGATDISNRKEETNDQ